MSDQDDILSREVAVSAKLDENGVSLRAKSRAVAALDRLVGSLLDAPAAFFEGVAQKRRLRDEINERLKQAQLELAERQVKKRADLGGDLVDSVLRDQARKQINAAGVAIEAVEALKALPAPDDTPSLDDQSADQAIDDDWLNQFARYAEDASSDQLQQIWGRVLAGEIHKPGSFSRHTLRFIAELDRETAENCELIGRHIIQHWFLKNDRWNAGNEYLATVDLQRLGVIEGIGIGGPQQSFDIDANGVAAIAGQKWGLLVRGTPGTKLQVSVVILTRMGREVMSLLEVAEERESLREVANTLNKNGLESIELAQVKQLGNGRVNFPGAGEMLWKCDASH